MKKLKLFIIVPIVLTLFIGCGCENKTLEEKPIEDQVIDKTDDIQGVYSFKDVKISRLGASNVINGVITNNSDETKENIVLEIEMLNKSGNLVGITEVTVESVGAHETKEFEGRIVGDYSDADEFKVTVK